MQGLPENLYTAAQVREMDRTAIKDHGIAGIQLMRRAGSAVFEQLRLRWPHCKELIVFCGSGNNAGDGYVVARLALLAGIRVYVVTVADPQGLRGDAFTAHQDFIRVGGLVAPFREQSLPEQAVIVDALLGTGLDREVSGAYAAAVEVINVAPCPVIAVDIPSGLNSDTGDIMGRAVKASCTVSFIALKQGLFTAEAAEYCGDIVYSGLQLPAEIPAAIAPSARLVQKQKWSRRHRCAHKGHFGHVVLVGGDCGYTGAIRLAAEAALRSGAGLVTVATRETHSHVINCGRPEIMSHAVETPEQLNALLVKASVVVVGPGLGQSSWAHSLFSVVMASEIDCVADADALNLLARHTEPKANLIITPHPGEAARLLKLTTADIALDRFAAVTKLQQRFGGIAILKGAGTLIKDDQALYVSTTGNPGMASGGMGDVLSGLIGGLIAQGMTPSMAAQQGVYVHGAAADKAVEKDGERGLLASDLLPLIRKLLN